MPSLRRTSLSYLVTEGLHYCCLWRFFSLYQRETTETISLRLGCSTSAVRKNRALWEKGCLGCEGSPRCSKASVPPQAPSTPHPGAASPASESTTKPAER